MDVYRTNAVVKLNKLLLLQDMLWGYFSKFNYFVVLLQGCFSTRFFTNC
jgi:hypothetical protein